MTKLQIISHLWSSIYDFLLREKETEDQLKKTGITIKHQKPLEEIQNDLDLAEIACRPYVDAEDEELFMRPE